MAQKIPQGQKKLTNIAVVRLKSHGKRFEIACYTNKVLNWREGIEKDLNEVVQTEQIYDQVEKGNLAKEKDLKAAFGTTNLEEICKVILKKGQLQVSDTEREVHLERIFRDIVQIIVERCVHPKTLRQLTPHTVESALRSIGFSTRAEDSAKKQALKGIESLCTEMPESFARAKMRLRITCPLKLLESIKEQLINDHAAQIEYEDKADETTSCAVTFVCDPSHYRKLDSLAIVTHAGEGVALQIVTATVLSDAVGFEMQGAFSDEAIQRVLNESSLPVSAPEVATPQGSAGYSSVAAAAPVVAPKAVAAPAVAAQAKPKGMRCSSCNADFEAVADYRSHCKSEWHNFNLKRKVKNIAPVDEEGFAEISLDIREGLLAVDS